MGYRTLEKLFYADSSSDRFARRERLLSERLNSESSFRTGIELKTGELFMAVPRELSQASELVLRRERRVSLAWRRLPRIATRAYVLALIMDEVVSSNGMEGVASTGRQIELALEAGHAAARDSRRPFQEFAHLYLGLVDGQVFPATLLDIRRVYDAVVRDALEKRNRVDGDLFRSAEVELVGSHGRILHEGVSPESKIKEMLGQWLTLAANEDIPELYRALLCHFLFEYIHPFYDGNGRTGRYLLSLQLSEALSLPTVLSLSRTIAENKNAYYKAFLSVERPLNAAEATSFVLTMMELIGATQEGLIADLEGRGRQLDELGVRVDDLDGFDDRARRALYYVGQMSLFNAFGESRRDDMAAYLGVSPATARKTLDLLAQRGLVRRVRQRPAIYVLTEAGKRRLGLEG